MAKKDSSSKTDKQTKRRWYQNLADSYAVVKRSYPWLPIALIAIPILSIAAGVAFGILSGEPAFPIVTGVVGAVTLDMFLLTMLLRPAMYKQLDGRVGAVYAVLSQIKRGWDYDEEPIAVDRNQNLVWQLVGRPGVVLVSEGPPSKVAPLLNNERKRIQRAISNVPITFVEVGNEEGQVPLKKLNSKLRSLKKVLTKEEVPAVANRLNALGSRGLPVPKGVDPYNTRVSRRAMRG